MTKVKDEMTIAKHGITKGKLKMTIIKHEMKMNYKSLFIWAISVGAFCFFCIKLYPSLEESLADMKEAYNSMGSLTKAFGLDKIGLDTVMGFYATQVAPIFSLGGALFAALLGTGMLSKEEGGHTAEFLYTLPIGRGRVLIQKFAAMFFIVVGFNLICCLINSAAFLLIGESVVMKAFLLYHMAQFFMHLEVASICYMISAFSKKNSTGLGLGIAILLYACDLMTKILPTFDNIKYVIPFYYSDAASIISTNRVDMKLLGVGIGIAMCAGVVSFHYYRKKDLTA